MEVGLEICLECGWLYSCFDDDKVDQDQLRLFAHGVGRKLVCRATELALWFDAQLPVDHLPRCVYRR